MRLIILTALALHGSILFAETCETTFYHAAVVDHPYASGVRVPAPETEEALRMIEAAADDLNVSDRPVYHAALKAKTLPEQIKWIFEHLHVASQITAGALEKKLMNVLQAQVQLAGDAARLFRPVFRRILERPGRDLLPYFEELRVLAFLTNSTPAGYPFALPVQMKILAMGEELPELDAYVPKIEEGILQILSWQGRELTEDQRQLFAKILNRHLAAENAPERRLLIVSSYLSQLMDASGSVDTKALQNMFRDLVKLMPTTIDVSKIPADLVTPYADMFRKVLSICQARPRLVSREDQARVAGYADAFTLSPKASRRN